MDDLDILFWNELMNILGADITSKPPMVRRSWPQDGAPDWTIEDNVVFFQLVEEPADIAVEVHTEYVNRDEDLTESNGRTRVLRLSLIAYGKESYANCLKIRRAFYDGRKNLRINQIYLIPEQEVPVRAPELFQGRWWPRCDLKMSFNALDKWSNEVNAIKEVDVTINATAEDKEIATDQIIIKKG